MSVFLLYLITTFTRRITPRLGLLKCHLGWIFHAAAAREVVVFCAAVGDVDHGGLGLGGLRRGCRFWRRGRGGLRCGGRRGCGLWRLGGDCRGGHRRLLGALFIIAANNPEDDKHGPHYCYNAGAGFLAELEHVRGPQPVSQKNRQECDTQQQPEAAVFVIVPAAGAAAAG